MKTLVELAKEWDQTLVVTYEGRNAQWRAYFLYGTCRNREPYDFFGFGNSPDAALKEYAQRIRGQEINFGSLKYPHYKNAPKEILA